MDVTVKLYTDDIAKAAKLALMHRLYVPRRDYYLFEVLTNILKLSPEQRFNISLALVFKEEFPIAVAFKRNQSLMAFVKKAHRLKGYGSLAVSAFPQDTEAFANEGLRGTSEFWKKNGIRVRDYR